MGSGRRKIELSPRLKMGVGRGRSQNQVLKMGAIFCLVVAMALTANAFRLVLKGNTNAGNSLLTAATPQVLGASDIKTELPETNPSVIEYKVTKGDTLFNISQKFNISWTTLATLNNLKSPFVLKQGQTVRIPR